MGTLAFIQIKVFSALTFSKESKYRCRVYFQNSVGKRTGFLLAVGFSIRF